MTGQSNARKGGGFNIKETLTAVVISFTMAFVFRGFVIEGFLIPTGSMAPTLLGKHMLIRDADSGVEWTVGPWDYANGNPNTPFGVQGGARGAIRLNDPITGATVERATERLRAGDRLFVLKYLKGVYEPERWDVVVFKAPHVEPQNYIKRLVGLPGEQISIVDGDVFYTDPGNHVPVGDAWEAGTLPGTDISAWESDAWETARKPERVQREVWQTVFDSSYTPDPVTQQSLAPSERFVSPWSVSGAGWTGVDDSEAYRYGGSGTTVLSWDSDVHPIDDYTSYNQLRGGSQSWDRSRDRGLPVFPVSDIAMRFGIEPETDGVLIEGLLTARGFEFRAVLGGGEARIERRTAPTAAEPDPAWAEMHRVQGVGPLAAGRVNEVEFWHVDQALWLFVDGELVCGGPVDGAYKLTPAQRVLAATGRSLESLLEQNPSVSPSALADTRIYRKASPRWRFEGSAFTLHRVGLDRDLHYQTGRKPTLGGHPAYFPTLSDEHYMFCGDNSANSEDSRYWRREYPWVTETVHNGTPNYGLVHEDLVIGRAFVVYLPSPYYRGWIPMFDFSKMRWIW